MNPNKLLLLIVFALVASVATADTKGPFIMSVDDIRELEPGAKWDPETDDVLVQVRGYLRNVANLYLYATKDQALLDDISGVLVSDEGEGELRRNCSDGFVEIVARLGWLKAEQRVTLVPTKAKRLTLREHRRAEQSVCWNATTATGR